MEDFVSGGKQNVVGAVPNTGIGHAALRLKGGARRQRKVSQRLQRNGGDSAGDEIGVKWIA
jgi:hypothetical protein